MSGMSSYCKMSKQWNVVSNFVKAHFSVPEHIELQTFTEAQKKWLSSNFFGEIRRCVTAKTTINVLENMSKF